MSTFIRRSRALAIALGLITLTTLAVAPAASAATATLSRSTLSATVSGSTVTATTRIAASPATWASLAGICARDDADNHYDFPMSAATLSTGGVTLTKSRTFPAGTYTYWACAKLGGAWNAIGATQTFTVGTALTGSAAPSGQAMPVGDLPGWKQVFTDDFTTEAAQGSFHRLYGSRWATYHGFNDTYGHGRYDRNFISTKGGLMDFDLHSENGQPISFAPAPIVTKEWKGQTYGRFTARMRADALPGFKTAWLLWPDSNNWNEGEIDFPESGLTGTMYGFNHCIGTPSKNCFWVNSGARFTDWHTVTIEWSPNKLTYILDGRVLGTTTTSVPSTPMHWILQTETESKKPAPDVAGHLQVDWVAIYTYQP